MCSLREEDVNVKQGDRVEVSRGLRMAIVLAASWATALLLASTGRAEDGTAPASTCDPVSCATAEESSEIVSDGSETSTPTEPSGIEEPSSTTSDAEVAGGGGEEGGPPAG